MPTSIASTNASELEEIGLAPLPEHGRIDRVAGARRRRSCRPTDRRRLQPSPALGSTARAAEITGFGKAAGVVERLQTLRQFLDGAGYGEATRRRMPGDASIRLPMQLDPRTNVSFILMNFQKRPDGPAIYDGKPYSAAVHLAEDVKPFVAIDNGLRGRGLSAPAIHHADIEAGFLITEDFGFAGIIDGDPPAPMHRTL